MVAEEIDFPCSSTFLLGLAAQGSVRSPPRDVWDAWVYDQRVHLRYIDGVEAPPAPTAPLSYKGIGEREMSSPKQRAQADRALARRMAESQKRK